MNGRQRILTALAIKPPDGVPLYIHGINEGPIIGIGKHLTDNLPKPRDFRLMNDHDKLKLVDTLFMIHEEFDIDGITTFETGHETQVDDLHVKDGFGVVYKLSGHGIPVPVGHPVKTLDDLKTFHPPGPKAQDLGLLHLANDRFKGMMLAFNLAQIDLLADAGLDVLVIEDDIATTKMPMISPDQVEQAVIQAIQDGAEGGGLILCPSNSLHPGVDPENCIAMFKAARRQGVYKKDPHNG